MQARAFIWVFLFFLSSLQGFAQTDTRFWFVAPNVTTGHDGGRLEFNIRFSSLDFPAQVIIRMPANPDFDPIIRNLGPNETQTVDMTGFFNEIRNHPPNNVLNKGLLIESTNDITAYYEISTPNNPDIYALKGDNALGEEFYVPFQNFWDNSPSYNPRPYSSIDIVATQDNTDITITPTRPVFPDRPAGVPFTITLNRGQSFAVVPDDYDGDGQLAENHLGGTKIESNRPVTVISSDDSIDALTHPGQGGCKDVVGDQIIPTDLIGTEYIAMKGYLTAYEHFYIIGTQDGTLVYIDEEYETTIDEGGVFRYEFDKKTYHIKTSYPSYVYHVGGFGCEMGAALLPPINVCTGSTQVSFTRSKGESFFLNILVRTGAEDGFILNGDPELINADDFVHVLGNPDWLVGEFEFGEGIIPVGAASHIENTIDVFHLGIINGGATTGTMYGYFSDFNEMDVDVHIDGSEMMLGCHGDCFQIIASGGIDYIWEPPDYLDDPTSPTPIACPPEPIVYTVIASGACQMTDSARVTINLVGPVVTLYTVEEATGCSPFEAIIYNHSMGVENYSWRFGDGQTSTSSADTLKHTYINENDDPVIYDLELVGRTLFCRDTLATEIVVFPGVEAEIMNEDISGCAPVTVSFENNSRGASNYLWNFGDGASSTHIEPTHTFHNYSKTDTTYMVVLEALSEHGCIDYDTVMINVKPYVKSGFEFDPPAHCNPYPMEITNTSVGATSHIWDFDDGAGQIEINEDTIYYLLENTGELLQTFNIQLYTFNDYDCSDTLIRQATVYPYLKAEFEPSAIEGCNPLEVSFNNISEGASTYHWDFGYQQGSSSEHSPEHVFHNPSSTETAVFNVVLTATSDYDCEDTASMEITVYPRVEAGFTFEKSSYCSPYDVIFYNNSIGAETVYWDFGDGTGLYDPSDEVIHTYENLTDEPIVYTVTQTVENEQGCQDVMEKDITIYPEIEADFSITGFGDGCHPLEVIFLNNSIGADHYHWDFGDGGTSSKPSPTRKFYNYSHTEIEQYNITLTAESDYGCIDSITKQLIVNPKPKAVFHMPVNQGCAPLTVDFIDQSIGGETYHWIFGDGEETTTGPGDIYHTYDNTSNQSDSLNPNLIITNQYECKDTTKNMVVVYPEIIADFDVSKTSGCHPLEVTIYNNSSGATGSPPYNWHYGDGNTSTNQDPEHTHVFYNFDHKENAYYTITLIAKSEYGCEDTVSIDITVHPVPNAYYVVDEHIGCSPHTVEFTDLSIGGNRSYLWTFGDGETSGVQGDVTHTYTQPPDAGIGTFYSELEITNIYDCSDQHQKTITVYPDIEADFTADKMEGCHPLTVAFENLSKGADFYQWDFGDGNHSNKFEPENTFFNNSHTTTAKYDVQLYVSSQYGCEATVTKPVTVFPRPEVSFDTDVTEGCSPLYVLFENLSIGADYYEWDFGNGTSQTSLPQFEHLFENTGNEPVTYNVHLTGSNQWGCSEEDSRNITVYPEVTADYTTSTGEYKGCTPLHIDFINKSELADEYLWLFGTTAKSTEVNPSHTFFNEGNEDVFIDVKLIAKSLYGCEDSVEKTVTVHPQPIADFEALPHEQFFPSTTVTVYNYSSDGNWSYDWDMGDGTTFTTHDKSPFEHTYSWESGEYATRHFYIDLEVYNDYCSDDIQQKVTITAPHPIVGFSPSASGCPPFEVQFTNESKYGYYFFWDFDDGNYSDEENPSHIFENHGIYNVTLKVTGEGGVDSAKQVITVFEPPIANFRVEPEIVQFPLEPVRMINLSSLGSTYEWDLGDGTISWDYEPEHYYKAVGIYDITLTVGTDTDPQCFDEIIKQNVVIVEDVCKIVFPNAFKPKKSGPTGGYYNPNDPSNHIFHPLYDGIDEEKYVLEIYNRWGELIFRTTDPKIGWDGYYRDKLVTMDVYVWKVNATCYNGEKIEETGDVTVIR